MNELVAIVASEILGYKTEKVGIAEREANGITSTWAGLAAKQGPNKGFDYHMELWAKQREFCTKYVNDAQAITIISDTGYLAEEGWYINSGTQALSSKPLDLYRSFRSKEILQRCVQRIPLNKLLGQMVEKVVMFQRMLTRTINWCKTVMK